MSVSELVRHYRKSLLARVNLLGSFHDRHLLYEAALSGRNLVLMCSRCVPFAEGPSLGTTVVVAKAKVRSKAQSLRGRNPTFQKSGLIFGPENQNFPFPTSICVPRIVVFRIRDKINPISALSPQRECSCWNYASVLPEAACLVGTSTVTSLSALSGFLGPLHLVSTGRTINISCSIPT